MAQKAEELLRQGRFEAEIAQIMNQARRDIGVQYKNVTPERLREYIYEVNKGRYGDPLGPTYEYLKANGKTDAQIIQSASRPNPDVDKLLSGFEKWLKEQ